MLFKRTAAGTNEEFLTLVVTVTAASAEMFDSPIFEVAVVAVGVVVAEGAPVDTLTGVPPVEVAMGVFGAFALPTFRLPNRAERGYNCVSY